MRPWIFGLVASFAIAGCSRGTGSEYYPPLKSGSQLRYVGQYTGTFGAVQRTEMVTRVEDEERINDHAYWRVVTVVTGMPDMTPQVTYARFDSAGMHLIDGAHRAFGEYLDVPFPVAVGTSWIVSRDRDAILSGGNRISGDAREEVRRLPEDSLHELGTERSNQRG